MLSSIYHLAHLREGSCLTYQSKYQENKEYKKSKSQLLDILSLYKSSLVPLAHM